jgi:ribosomal protein S18 acetylase RimI-like enzyme
MNDATMCLAAAADLDRLLPLMRGYYRDDGLTFDELRAKTSMERLLSDATLGFVVLAEVGAQTVGYAAACLSYSLEFGGRDAFLDELFVLPDYRRRGFARQLLREVATAAQRQGVIALHLEVDRDNDMAQRLYTSLGYEKRARYFVMSKTLVDERFL